MVLDKKQTTFAYRCPACGAGVISAVDIFALSAPMIKLKCSCGGSEALIEKQSDGKIRLTVPCLICPKPHTYLLSPAVFFGKDEFFLNCMYSDMNIGFLGDMDYVKANLAKSELELLDLMEKCGMEDFSAIREANDDDPDDALDSELTQSVLFVLSELEAEGKIFCRCNHAHADGDEIDSEKYGFEINADGIRVVCRDCGAERVIPTDNSLNTHAFLDADALYLE